MNVKYFFLNEILLFKTSFYEAKHIFNCNKKILKNLISFFKILKARYKINLFPLEFNDSEL